MTYSRILIKTATTAGAVPTTSDLELREIAFDDVDTLYIRKTDGAIVAIGGDGVDSIDDVPGLTSALAAKADSSHTQAISTITGLQDALDAKAATADVGTIASVSGLQAALDAKADASHTQAISTVTGLQAALDAKAATSHTQAISTITSLQTALDAKADATAISNPYVTVGTATLSGTTLTLDHSTGVLFKHTATSALTIALSNAPTAGEAVYVLRLTNGGAYTVTWPSGIVWLGGTAPTLTASGTDEIYLRRSVDGTVVQAFTLTGF